MPGMRGCTREEDWERVEASVPRLVPRLRPARHRQCGSRPAFNVALSVGQSLHLAPFAGEHTSIHQVERGGDIKDAAVALRVTRFRDRAHTMAISMALALTKIKTDGERLLYVALSVARYFTGRTTITKR